MIRLIIPAPNVVPGQGSIAMESIYDGLLTYLRKERSYLNHLISFG